MVAGLILAAALQPVPAPVSAQPVPVCSLVTPGGDRIGFLMLPWDDGGVVGVIPTRGSVWPRRTLPAAPASVDRPPAGKYWLSFGGEPGLMLELEPAQPSARQTATLLRRQGRRPGLPLAFGFCEPGPRPTIYAPMNLDVDPRQIDADIPAFDPDQWPQNRCALLISDGRRMPFRFRLSGPRTAAFSGDGLWSGRTVTAPIRWLRAQGGVQLGAFERRGGPRGTQRMIVDPAAGQAGKMIYLSEIGDPSLAGQSGYGMCGYVGLVRRAVREN